MIYHTMYAYIMWYMHTLLLSPFHEIIIQHMKNVRWCVSKLSAASPTPCRTGLWCARKVTIVTLLLPQKTATVFATIVLSSTPLLSSTIKMYCKQKTLLVILCFALVLTVTLMNRWRAVNSGGVLCGCKWRDCYVQCLCIHVKLFCLSVIELGRYLVAVWGTMVVQHFQLLNIYIIKVMSKHPDWMYI